jgi:hypothetical protein
MKPRCPVEVPVGLRVTPVAGVSLLSDSMARLGETNEDVIVYDPEVPV